MTERTHPGDKALFTGPYVKVTADVINELKAGIRAHEERYTVEFPQLIAECPYETRLAVACATVKHICDHAREGGTYRYLIYERMGFGPDAYAPMQFAGALDVSNEFVLAESGLEEADRHHAHALRDAFQKLETSDERTKLMHAYFRFEELAAHARVSMEIIERQRRELAERQGSEAHGP